MNTFNLTHPPTSAASPTKAGTRTRARSEDVDVLVADDCRSTSYHVWASVSGQRGIAGVSTSENVDQVFSLVAQHAAALCMVSANFGPGEGLTVAHRLTELPHRPAVLIYADEVNSWLAGAAAVAGAQGVFAAQIRPEELGEMATRAIGGERLFPALLPDPFDQLAEHVAEEDRRIVAMLLLGADPDEIADLLGISAGALEPRRRAIVGRLDAAYLRLRSHPAAERTRPRVSRRGRSCNPAVARHRPDRYVANR